MLKGFFHLFTMIFWLLLGQLRGGLTFDQIYIYINKMVGETRAMLSRV